MQYLKSLHLESTVYGGSGSEVFIVVVAVSVVGAVVYCWVLVTIVIAAITSITITILPPFQEKINYPMIVETLCELPLLEKLIYEDDAVRNFKSQLAVI